MEKFKNFKQPPVVSRILKFCENVIQFISNCLSLYTIAIQFCRLFSMKVENQRSLDWKSLFLFVYFYLLFYIKFRVYRVRCNPLGLLYY